MTAVLSTPPSQAAPNFVGDRFGAPLPVAVVVAQLSGGGGLLALRGARIVDPRLFTVTVVTGGGTELIEEARAAGLEVVVIPQLRAPIDAPADLRVLQELVPLFRSRQFAAVHTHCAKAGALGRVAARLVGVPWVVHTYHGFPFHQFQSRARRLLYISIERKLGQLTDVALCVGAGVAAEAVRRQLVLPERVRTIGVTVDGPDVSAALVPEDGARRRQHARAVLGLPADATVIGTVGRLTFQKAPEDFLAALSALRRPEVTGVWIGGGEEADRMRAMAASPSAPRLLLLGERRDVLDLLPAFDLFVMTSRYEGLPTAIVEAMVCGVPVVATAVNAVPDVVVPGETGLLVAPGHPALMAEAMRYMLDSPSAAARMAATARRRLGDRFSEPALRCALEAAYLEAPIEDRVPA